MHSSSHFCCAQWMAIPIEYEFRGFVCSRRLTALSQYYVHCHFPHMLAQRKEIVTRICSFFETQVRAKLPADDMVVDFVYAPEDRRVYVLEMNPFCNFEGAGTGTALFLIYITLLGLFELHFTCLVCLCVWYSKAHILHYHSRTCLLFLIVTIAYSRCCHVQLERGLGCAWRWAIWVPCARGPTPQHQECAHKWLDSIFAAIRICFLLLILL